jgi:hypothetical protein
MPSRQEAFGAMAAEAMSCGKMVLAINGTSLPDVINSPDCGIAVEEKDFTFELQRLINHPMEIIERGQKSLVYAQKNYNKDIYVNRMMEIYREVIANHVFDDNAKLIFEQLKKHRQSEKQTYHPMVIKLKNKFMKMPGASFMMPIVKPFAKFSYKAVRKLYRMGKRINKT